MSSNTQRWIGTAALAALLTGCLHGGARLHAGGEPARSRTETPAPVADTIERFGALELVTHTRHYRGGDPGRIGTTHDWSLRWQGRPLEIATRGGMFGDEAFTARRVNAVFVVGEGDARELIVNVGDPNNTSAFHALRVKGDSLETPLLCTSLAGDNTVGWLDGPAAMRGDGSGRHAGPQKATLSGGRRLSLGSRCVYDTAKQRAVVLPREPMEWAVLYRLGQVARSADGTVAAYIAMLPRGDEPHALHVATLDVDAGRWSALPIDRSRMRYTKLDALDPTWVAHHFEWRRGADGREQLAERRHFEPLPRRGHYDQGDAAQYTLEDLRDGARHRLRDFVVQRFGAQPLPLGPYEDGKFLSASLRGQTVVFSDASVHVEVRQRDAAHALIHEIGDTLDAELAAGRLQELFE